MVLRTAFLLKLSLLAVFGGSRPGPVVHVRGKLGNSPQTCRHPTALPAPGRITRGPYAGHPRRPAQDRQHHLVFEQQRELVNALTFAEADQSQRPLSAFLTIIWRHSADFREADWVRRERLLWLKVGKWLKRKGVEHRCIWVREYGFQKGPHLHALLDVPNRVRGELGQFIQKTERLRAGGVHLAPSRTAKQHLGLLRYLMKCADGRDFRYRGNTPVNVRGDVLGIEPRGSSPPVKVQRCGVTPQSRSG